MKLDIIFSHIRIVLNPVNWFLALKFFIKSIPTIAKKLFLYVTFFILLFVFVSEKIYMTLAHLIFSRRIMGTTSFNESNRFAHFYHWLYDKIEMFKATDVKRSYLINIAYRNLLAKKTRSIVTIVGMSFGVGVIVFLLSLGYGIEKLIIGRVARLDELKVVDVSIGQNNTLRLNTEAQNKIKKIKNVQSVIPLISLVGRVTLNKAVTDVLVYAASPEYLKILNLNIVKGKLLVYDDSNQFFQGVVAGAKTELAEGVSGKKIDNDVVEFNLRPEEHGIAYMSCDIQSKVRGQIARIEGGYRGTGYWGSEYAPFRVYGRAAFDKFRQTYVGKWMKATMPLYVEDEKGGLTPQLDTNGRALWDDVCIPQKYLTVSEKYSIGQVLGEATGSGTLLATVPEATDTAELSTVIVSTSSGGIELVSLDSTASKSNKKSENIHFRDKIKQEALVYLTP